MLAILTYSFQHLTACHLVLIGNSVSKLEPLRLRNEAKAQVQILQFLKQPNEAVSKCEKTDSRV